VILCKQYDTKAVVRTDKVTVKVVEEYKAMMARLDHVQSAVVMALCGIH
jgi:predicted butyrate kinase (DUF1464 family)